MALMRLPSARAISPVQGTSGIPGFSYLSVFVTGGRILTLKDLSLVSNNCQRTKSVYPDLSPHYYTFPKLFTPTDSIYSKYKICMLRTGCSEMLVTIHECSLGLRLNDLDILVFLMAAFESLVNNT